MQERSRIFDAAVNMGFSGKIHDGVQALGHHFSHARGIGNVAADKPVTRIFSEIGQVFQITGIGQLVEVDDLHIFALQQHVPDEVGTYESRAPGD